MKKDEKKALLERLEKDAKRERKTSFNTLPAWAQNGTAPISAKAPPKKTSKGKKKKKAD